MTGAHGTAESQGADEGLHHLLTRMRDGHEDAFSAFFIRFEDQIRSLIQKEDNLIDDAEAGTIALQVALKVQQGSGKYRGRSKMGRTNNTDAVAWSWVKRVTINHLIDLSRGAKRIPRAKIESLDRPLVEKDTGAKGVRFFGALLSSADPPVETRVAHKIGWEEFVSSLSDVEFELCSLRLEGKTQKEIAGELGYSPARISQILKTLRARAAARGFDEAETDDS